MKKIIIALLFISIGNMLSAQNQDNMNRQEKKQTAGRDALGNFAPKFAELNDDVLFGEVWSREAELSPRDRSMITIATLIGSGAPEFTLKAHLQKGRENGISKDEIAEIITHIAFYAGWPKAWGAFNAAKEIYAEEIAQDPSGGNAGYIFGIGNFNEAYKAYFSGKSYLNTLAMPDKSNTISVLNVTFEPACRNNWHIHTTEQILLVTEGTGWYQEWGKPAQFLQKGDAVTIPKDVKHWHGATADSWFAHISIMDTVKDKTEWKEAVSDEEYKKLSKQRKK